MPSLELDPSSSAFPVVPSPPDPQESDGMNNASGQANVKEAFQPVAEGSSAFAEPSPAVIPARGRRMSRTNSQEAIANGLRSPVAVQSPVRCYPKEHTDFVKIVMKDSEKSYFCLHCGFQSLFEEDMFLSHMPFHTRRGKHSCSNCNFSSDDPATTVMHITQHKHRFSFDLYTPKEGNIVEIYRCRHCPFESVFQEDYSDHILQHWDKPQSRFHCSLCSFCAPDQRSIVAHESLHYLQRPRFLDGVVKYTRKYQSKDDRTPFLLQSDIPKPKSTTQRRPMSEGQKQGLRRMLGDY